MAVDPESALGARSGLHPAGVRRRSLRVQLLVGLGTVTALPLVAFAAFAGVRLLHSVDREAAARLVAEASTVAERVDEYITNHRRAIAMLAVHTPGTHSVSGSLNTQLPKVGRVFDGFLTMLVADSAGAIVAVHAQDTLVSLSEAIGRSVADRAYFREPMASGKSYVSDAFRGRNLGTDPIVAIASPIPGEHGQPVGVVEGSLNLNRFSRFARGTSSLVQGQLVIVDRSGRVVYAFNAAHLEFLESLSTTALGMAMANKVDSSRWLTYDEPEGAGPVFAAIANSERTGWRVIVTQPRAAARNAEREHLFTILLGILVATGLSVLLALRLANRVTRPIATLSSRLRSFEGIERPILSEECSLDAPAEVEMLLRDFVAMSSRIHESTSAQQASEARFRAIFDHAAIGIALHDDDGRFLESNAAFQRIVGFSAEELRQKRASELSSPEEAVVTREPVRALKAGLLERVAIEKRLLHRDGHSVLCELTVTRLQAGSLPNGHAGIVGMIQDVTERRAMEREMVWRANHDSLTGLSNRARLQDRLTEILEGSPLPRSVAVLMLDLDEFKRVNDSLGHAEGDVLLREVSQRLLSATRGCDSVARLGGDEFAVLLNGVGTPVYADVVAERILGTLKRPITLSGAEVVLSASIGIAYAEPNDSVDSLLRNADTAMYRAKHSGKASFDTFTPAMHAEVAELLSIEGDLRGALLANELYPVYQLIVNLETGEPVGAECLVRWRRGGDRLVSPAKFIPIAEQTGQIIPIGRWILREACKEGAAWLARTPKRSGDAPPFTLTVNVSGRQLHDDNLVADVRDALRDSGFDPRCLVLEITESVVMRNADVGIRRLEELKSLGVRIAIDDFGTGYSSLSYLQRLPIDVLKIDKSFIDVVTEPVRGAALVRTILRLADALSLRCVAEGIETHAQRDALMALGCAYGQGYYFAQPESGADACDRLMRNICAPQLPHTAPRNAALAG